MKVHLKIYWENNMPNMPKNCNEMIGPVLQ